MPETLLTIHEAAAIANKSVQTIRRALKAKKLVAKKQKTPQGFNYMVSEEALVSLYKVNRDRLPSAVKNPNGESIYMPNQTAITTEFATRDDLHEQKKVLDTLVDENRKDKETFMRFVKVFQDRFTALENQVKLLGEPGQKKRWFQFWKRA